MSYYMGDYYRGDYYRGDPFFGFLGGLIKKGVGALVGLGKKKLLKQPGGLGGVPVPSIPIPHLPPQVGKIISKIPPKLRKVGPVVVGAGVGIAASKIGGRVVDEFGRPVHRRRRMHVTNVKALRRAIRRAHGFAKLARKVMTFTSPRAPRGKATFKRRSRGKRI